jgi:type IV pilus assembly protein PilY1
MHKSHAFRWPAAGAAFGLTLLAAAAAHADDTEISVGQAQTAGVLPNILLVFDTSGSMDDDIDLTKAPYDPRLSYTGSCATDVLYWRRGVGSPPACNSGQRLPLTANVCAASSSGLVGDRSAGLWSGRFAQWDDPQKRWLPLDSQRSGVVECRNDAGVHGDGSSATWPTNGDPGPFTGTALNSIDWALASTYTLYTGNWLNWLYAPNETVTRSRLQAAAAAAKTLAYSIDGVNLGLMRFSSNAQGGMVTNAVANISTNRDALIADLEAFQADEATPLTETLYEAGQYLAGRAVDYGRRSRGNDGISFESVSASRLTGNTGTYKTPIEFSCQRNFIILLTDGLPASDNDADDEILDLPGFTTINPGGCTGADEGRCLDEMARYLRNRDLRPEESMPGSQNATTYTVGFGPAVTGSALLRTVAEAGGGESFTTSNVVDLTNALQQIVTDIAQRSSTFSTAAVAVNAFNRTQTTNELYISVFQPAETERWPGNLKKYTLTNGRIVDQFGADAVDPVTGFFNDTAQSLWSPNPADGQRVEMGGAVSRLPSPSTRKIFTYLPGATNASLNLTAPVNAVSTANAAALTDAVLGTNAAEPTRNQLIDWLRGVDVRDANGNGNRTEHNRFMGDPLHSRPALVTYGATAADSIVYVPTNDGLLHAVRGDTGAELWSFIPQELLPRLKDLYRDAGVVARTYGLDGEVRVLRFDIDQDGVIEAVDGDRVFVYVGMRRGGRAYYALDVTDRNAPKMLWRIGADATGTRLMPGMGESWSPPTLARVKIGDGTGQNGENLVLIFGGGYDATQEDPAFRVDTSGHRIYMVDAVSGNLLWFAGGPNGAGTPTLPLAKMTHSIPGRINVLDTDGNGFADRMYAGDMGGRVWRFDIWHGLEGAALVTGGVFADLGAASEETPTIENTRRFYNAPDVALIQRRGANPYFNLAIGSGYRGHPLQTATRDRFYSLRDTQPFGRLTQPQYDGFTAITDGILANITDTLTSTAIPRDARGWKLELRLNGAGEKVLAEALTINGTILFPTFQPQAPSAATPCAPGTGLNRAYALSVDSGRPVIDWNDNAQIEDSDAWTRLAQTGIAGEISYVFDTRTQPPNPPPNAPPIPRDQLGRSALCMVGVEVLRKCVPPGNVVRTFWQRGSVN